MYVHTHMETRGGCWETSQSLKPEACHISARMLGWRDRRICLILPLFLLGNRHSEGSFHFTWDWGSKLRLSYHTVSMFTLDATCHAFICSWNTLEMSRVCYDCRSNKPICSFVSKQSLSPSPEVHIYIWCWACPLNFRTEVTFGRIVLVAWFRQRRSKERTH